MAIIGKEIHVNGIVQGVGFRPFVYNHAINNNLTGWVRNTSGGVDIVINGAEEKINDFLDQLKHNPPPLSKITEIKINSVPVNSFTEFSIIKSSPRPGEFIPISPDVSLCEDCLSELFDPEDRRFQYPFINCTNCGPRFTIIQDIPYDRPYTTMSGFPLCDACENEYQNPLDRRFHAQPVACPECGPQVELTNSNGTLLSNHGEAIHQAQLLLIAGKSLAIKGLGGFHLACNALNEEAVKNLRNRKHRYLKPFALMAKNLEVITKYCNVSPLDQEVLTSRQRPIVILEKKNTQGIALSVAPGQKTLGMMLPYTPLHHLIFENNTEMPDVLVMTSGNISDEPIAYKDNDAEIRLGLIADAFLTHNRPIYIRTDDSVIKNTAGLPVFLRRSRGYVPDPLTFKKDLSQILAVGGELKNTFCLTKDKYAFISHHIGDLENFETYTSFKEGIDHFKRIFRIQPQYIASDLHPDYLSTRFADEYASSNNLPIVKIQHHHAHLAACLADNQWDGDKPVLGLCFDGTGYGSDGNIWGGEFLLGNYKGFSRVSSLKNFGLPGGEKAIQSPGRIALSLLYSAGLNEVLPPHLLSQLSENELFVIEQQIKTGMNSPQTSSIGRLFDGISALIGVCTDVLYEGQAAIELENQITTTIPEYYSFSIENKQIDIAPMVSDIIKDLHKETNAGIISAKFHNTILAFSEEIILSTQEQYGFDTIALSGGVWQNDYLFSNFLLKMKNRNIKVLTHKNVSPNDGGLSLGQALIASHYFRN